MVDEEFLMNARPNQYKAWDALLFFGILSVIGAVVAAGNGPEFLGNAVAFTGFGIILVQLYVMYVIVEVIRETSHQ